jgi:hypothetical protein
LLISANALSAGTLSNVADTIVGVSTSAARGVFMTGSSALNACGETTARCVVTTGAGRAFPRQRPPLTPPWPPFAQK